MVNGKVYDSKTTLKNIKVYNISQNITAYSDNIGDFSIAAKSDDSIVFSSLFYNDQVLLVTEKHLYEAVVIELKVFTNALNEVSLNMIKEKNEITLTEEAKAQQKNQIANDMKNNSHLYEPPPNGNMDFVKIFGLISKLLKKDKPAAKEMALNDDFSKLFESHSFFNETLLKEDLKITDDSKYLFFEYCEANQIDKSALSEENQLQLLEKLLQLSKSFRSLSENLPNKKQN